MKRLLLLTALLSAFCWPAIAQTPAILLEACNAMEPASKRLECLRAANGCARTRAGRTAVCPTSRNRHMRCRLPQPPVAMRPRPVRRRAQAKDRPATSVRAGYLHDHGEWAEELRCVLNTSRASAVALEFVELSWESDPAKMKPAVKVALEDFRRLVGEVERLTHGFMSLQKKFESRVRYKKEWEDANPVGFKAWAAYQAMLSN